MHHRAGLIALCLAIAALCAGCANTDGGSGATTDTDAADTTSKACFVDVNTSLDTAAFNDVFQDPQYAIIAREPNLGQTVCQPVDHWWTMFATGMPPTFFLNTGKRHTAGDIPQQNYQVTTADQHTFHLNKTVVWPGPGTHVHLRLVDDKGKVLVDPYFEYDVVTAH
jgi:predicted small secreted protein